MSTSGCTCTCEKIDDCGRAAEEEEEEEEEEGGAAARRVGGRTEGEESGRWGES